MKRLILFLCVAFFATTAFAQWQRVAEHNVGVTGQIVAHQNHLFVYGDNQGPRLYRSSDKGASWTELSSSISTVISHSIAHMYSFQDSLYSVYFGNVYRVTENGAKWSLKSSVTVTGGVLIGLTSYGNTLYAYSNRKSIFKSEDHGKTWTEIIINDARNLMMIDFAVVGNRYVAIMAGLGALVSEDGGLNWAEKHPTGTGNSSVFAHNNTIFGLTFGSGLYRLDSGSSAWVLSSTGMPNNGSFTIGKSMTASGATLFYIYSDLFSGQSAVFSSVDNGLNWSAVNVTGLPPVSGAATLELMSWIDNTLFCYASYLDPAKIGTFATPVTVSTAIADAPNTAASFFLSQNYPNPFNPSTMISFQLSVDSEVQVAIYSTTGQEVRSLMNGRMSRGNHSVVWDARDDRGQQVASGIYFYKLVAGGFQSTRRMVLVR
jgi:photosystem II stability/assembly factor-like uncharacterized protein